MITYSTEKEISECALERLFLSVNWESGKHPAKLRQAIQNSHHVVTAWEEDLLIGLVNALSDGVMTAYFHYMVVDPVYQGTGVGRKLLESMLDFYKDYPAKVLIAYESAQAFYLRCGFCPEEGTVPMFISELV